MKKHTPWVPQWQATKALSMIACIAYHFVFHPLPLRVLTLVQSGFVLYCKPIVMFNAYFPIINIQLKTIRMEFYFLWPKNSLDLDWTGPEPKLVCLRQAFF